MIVELVIIAVVAIGCTSAVCMLAILCGSRLRVDAARGTSAVRVAVSEPRLPNNPEPSAGPSSS